MTVAVVMDGARRYYDVARALARAGQLGHVYADWYARPGSPERVLARMVSKARPVLGRRLAERVAADLPPERVLRNPTLALWLAANRGRYPIVEDYYAWCSDRSAAWIRREGFGAATGLYGYIRNVHPRLFRQARRAGLRTVGEQMIAPAAVEFAEAERQAAAWPGWEDAPGSGAFTRLDRFERATWAEADCVVAPSEYVRAGLIGQGVPHERVRLVPYPAEIGPFQPVDRRGRPGPVVVGFVGQVNLRKNAPLLFEVARRFDPREVRFVVVGKSTLKPEVVAAHRGQVELIGSVPRSEVAGHLAAFDLFLFPSVCEGSAAVVIEAMATGLPVLTTPNAGSPVVDGADGFVLAPHDAAAFVERIAELVADPERRHAMGQSARARVAGLTLDRYGQDLVAAFAEGSADG